MAARPVAGRRPGLRGARGAVFRPGGPGRARAASGAPARSRDAVPRTAYRERGAREVPAQRALERSGGRARPGPGHRRQALLDPPRPRARTIAARRLPEDGDRGVLQERPRPLRRAELHRAGLHGAERSALHVPVGTAEHRPEWRSPRRRHRRHPRVGSRDRQRERRRRRDRHRNRLHASRSRAQRLVQSYGVRPQRGGRRRQRLRRRLPRDRRRQQRFGSDGRPQPRHPRRRHDRGDRQQRARGGRRELASLHHGVQVPRRQRNGHDGGSDRLPRLRRHDEGSWRQYRGDQQQLGRRRLLARAVRRHRRPPATGHPLRRGRGQLQLRQRRIADVPRELRSSDRHRRGCDQSGRLPGLFLELGIADRASERPGR